VGKRIGPDLIDYLFDESKNLDIVYRINKIKTTNPVYPVNPVKKKIIIISV